MLTTRSCRCVQTMVRTVKSQSGSRTSATWTMSGEHVDNSVRSLSFCFQNIPRAVLKNQTLSNSKICHWIEPIPLSKEGKCNGFCYKPAIVDPYTNYGSTEPVYPVNSSLEITCNSSDYSLPDKVKVCNLSRPRALLLTYSKSKDYHIRTPLAE